MKASIEHFSDEHKYCGEWCTSKYELRYSTHQKLVIENKNKKIEM